MEINLGTLQKLIETIPHRSEIIVKGGPTKCVTCFFWWQFIFGQAVYVALAQSQAPHNSQHDKLVEDGWMIEKESWFYQNKLGGYKNLHHCRYH